MKNFFNRLMYGKSNNADYTKEAIEGESRLKLFFDILGVKYMQLVKINFILLISFVPAIIWTWINYNMSGGLDIQDLAFFQIIYSAGMVPCLLIAAAPLAGVTYIIKNFTQDKHVWLWKDFISHTKSNAKQALLYMLIYSLILLLGQVVLYTYTVVMQASSLATILRIVYLVIYILFAVSIMYAYPMMVTYELKLKDLLKNSLLLTIGSLNTTVLGSVLALVPFAALIALSTVWGYGLIVLTLYFALFGLAFSVYIIVSFTTAVFDKHMNTSPDEETQEDQQESQ